MGACGAASFISFLFFKETFRTERSLAWQKARKLALEKAAQISGGNANQAAKEPSFIDRSYQLIMASLCRVRSKMILRHERTEAQSGLKGKIRDETDAPFSPPLYHDPPLTVATTTSATANGTLIEKTRSVKLGRSTSAKPAPGKRPSLAKRVTTTRSINRVVTVQGEDIKVSEKEEQGLEG